MSSPGLWVLALLRWLMFAGLAAALGGVAARGLARRHGGPAPAPLPGPWALRASLLGLVASAGLVIEVLGHGSLAAGLAHLWLGQLWRTRVLSAGQGIIALVEFASFGAAAVLLRLRRPGLSVLPLFAVVTAEGFRAHPEGIVPVGGALLTWAHLVPAALWAGMLLYVVRAGIAWRSDPAAVRRLVGLYSRAAAWLFATVVITGVVTALVLVPVGSLLTTSYGRVLIVKAALVTAAACLALAGRMWLRREPRPGAGPALATKLEIGTLAVVLAVTALLSGLNPPRAPIRPLGYQDRTSQR